MPTSSRLRIIAVWLRTSTAAKTNQACREELKALVCGSFDDSDGTYGHRRVHADLVARGVRCGPELVRSLMRELGLEPCQPRPWRFSLTGSDGQEHHIPDLVPRDFTAEAPGQKMVADITYIPTWEGWVYLATVIDCYTKAVVGWAVGDDYKTRRGPLQTASSAPGSGPGQPAAGTARSHRRRHQGPDETGSVGPPPRIRPGRMR
jgi:transposase InsO family protein